MPYRLPAEWEAQSGILLAWPHTATDWAELLELVEPVYINIIKEITRFQPCVVATPDPKSVLERLEAAGIPCDRVHLYPIQTNDTWTRDFGPVTVLDENRPILLDFGFNGWGLKFASNLDNQVTRLLHESGAFGDIERRTIGMVLEGGSLESDGCGTLLTTAECLLNPNRNPHLNREEIEEQLQHLLGAEQVLWLENGYLKGDDTDSHIDTLARLCPNNTILFQGCDDENDEHYSPFIAMVDELKRFRTRNGAPYRLLPLPWPQPRYEGNDRLPATYANFLVINGAVLVPTYDDPRDQVALDIVAKAYPDREIIGIDCLPLIRQHGSLHCITMQIPEGVSL
jgi:agmatine deiminase